MKHAVNITLDTDYDHLAEVLLIRLLLSKVDPSPFL